MIKITYDMNKEKDLLLEILSKAESQCPFPNKICDMQLTCKECIRKNIKWKKRKSKTFTEMENM